MLKRILYTVALATVLGQAPAHAATFQTESGFGGLGGGFSSCKSGLSTAAFATGTALSTGDVGPGCVGYFDVVIDSSAQTITLHGLEPGNYDSGFLDISGISEAVITGLSTVSYVGLFDPNYYGDPAQYGGIPTPMLSFTGNSIHIAFTTFGGSPPQFTYGSDGASAVFSYSVGGGVPEPATWAMMIVGFGLIGTTMRRQKTVAA